MSIKLTDREVSILNAAVARDDRCLVAPTSLKRSAAQNLAAKLLGAGLAREIKAKGERAVWRRDEDGLVPYSLKLTVAGMKSVSVAQGASPTKAAAPESSLPIPVAANAATTMETAQAEAASAPSTTAPREGTKIGQVIGLLQRNHGATLDEVVAATGWLPHTARAALTGLRKRGYSIERRREDEGASRYLIVAAARS